jgi:hypothetical protein
MWLSAQSKRDTVFTRNQNKRVLSYISPFSNYILMGEFAAISHFEPGTPRSKNRNLDVDFDEEFGSRLGV